jgi:transcriptional regulator with XRE-family HTH domain
VRVNAALVIALRAKKAWSQEELSIASGLNLRTIQRIEKEASASLQSIKALASAFAIGIKELEPQEATAMKKYEYKTVELPFRFGILKQGVPDIEAALNAEGEDGWRLLQIVIAGVSNFGQPDKMIAILEREKTA